MIPKIPEITTDRISCLLRNSNTSTTKPERRAAPSMKRASSFIVPPRIMPRMKAMKMNRITLVSAVPRGNSKGISQSASAGNIRPQKEMAAVLKQMKE